MCEHGILHIERPAAHVHTQSGCVHVCVCVYRGPCKWLSVCARWCARAFAARGVTFKFSAIAGLIVVHDALHFVDACGSGDVRASLCAVWCACACVGVFFFCFVIIHTALSPILGESGTGRGAQASEHDAGDCALAHTHTFVLNTKHVCACVFAAASVFGASPIERIFGRCAPETFNWKCKRTGEIARARERDRE